MKKQNGRVTRYLKQNASRATVRTADGLAALAPLAAVARQERVHYALAGGIAMHLYGFTRATADVDVIASAPLPLESQGELSFGGQKFVVEVDGQPVPVDWIVRADELEDLYRAALTDLVELERGVYVVSPEWLVLLKHFAGRGKDEMDLLWLLRADELVDRRQLLAHVRGHFGKFAYTVVQELESWFLQADLMRAKDERGK